jgi:hypothetical protein
MEAHAVLHNLDLTAVTLLYGLIIGYQERNQDLISIYPPINASFCVVALHFNEFVKLFRLSSPFEALISLMSFCAPLMIIGFDIYVDFL